MNLGTFKAQTEIGALTDRIGQMIVEAGPPSMRIEFGRREIEREEAACAAIGTAPRLMVERTGKGRFRIALPQNGVGRSREPLAPDRIGEVNAGRRGSDG